MTFTSRQCLGGYDFLSRSGTSRPLKDKFPQAFLPRLGTWNVDVAAQKICHSGQTGLSDCVRGRTREASAKAAVAMKRFSGWLAGSLFAASAVFFALPHAAHAIGMIRISDPSLCIDSMPDPDSDELEPILVAADGGCTVTQPETPILI